MDSWDDIFNEKSTSSYKKEDLNRNFDYVDDLIQGMLDEVAGESAEEREKKMLCARLMNEYLLRHGKTMDDNYSEIVHAEFEISSDWDHKIKILEDALEHDLLLENSKYYPEILEGFVSEDDHFFK